MILNDFNLIAEFNVWPTSVWNKHTFDDNWEKKTRENTKFTKILDYPNTEKRKMEKFMIVTKFYQSSKNTQSYCLPSH